MSRTILAGLVPVARQRMVLANSTALAVNSTIRTAKANVLGFSVEGASVRQSSRGLPTLATGVLYLTTLGPYYFQGFNGTATFRFQRTTGTAIVNIEAYKQVGS